MTPEEAGALSPEESLRITHEQGWTGGHNPWTVALVVTMATFMEVLDTAIANVSLPHIAGSLSVSPDESTWVLTSYLVSNAVVLPISGWVATRIGRKRFYLTCVLLFTISSFLCGLAPNLGLLIFFRVLQGVGGGGLAPSEQAILADTFPPARRGMAFAVYGMAVVLAPAIGPTLGGFITDHYSWRWVFFINVPVGIASMLLSSRILVDPPHLVEAKKRVGPIDSIGLGLIALGLGALEIVLDKGQEDDWFNSHTIVAFSIIAAVALVSFVVWDMALYGSTVLLPLYLQVWMGYSAQDAGMVLSPGGLMVILLLPLVGKLLGKVDARYLIMFGFLVTSVALFHMARTLYPGIDFKTAVMLRIFQTSGIAFLFVPINAAVYNGVPPGKNNQVSGIVNLFRNMGGDIGIALVATLIARRSQFHQARLVEHVAPSAALDARIAGIAQHLQQLGVGAAQSTKMAYGQIYGEVIKQAQTLAYLDMLVVLAVFCALMVPAVLLTRKVKAGGAAMAH